MRNYLIDRLNDGYHLIVVRRKVKDKYLCSKDLEVHESGTIKDYDEFSFEPNVSWDHAFNVIYNIEELIGDN